MGIETALLIAAVASAAGSAIGGIQQSREARSQANKASEEAELQSRAEARETIKLEKQQKLAFLKSGVALEGSPLLLLSETKRKGKENIEAITESGRVRASSIRASGRGALISGLTSAAGTAAGGFGGGTEDFGQTRTGRAPTPSRKPLR